MIRVTRINEFHEFRNAMCLKIQGTTERGMSVFVKVRAGLWALEVSSL